jgi:putative flippase GtrA
VGPVTSNVLGYSVGLVVSYLLNRAFTFRSPSVSKVEFLRFVSIVLLAYGANLAVLVFLIRHTEVHKALAQVLAGIVYFALSFLMNKYYVFAAGRRHSPGA